MPLFIRHSPNPNEESFFKVENWYSNPNTSEVSGLYVENGHRLFICDCQPATETEYLSYKNQQP